MHAITQKFILFYNPRLTKIMRLPKVTHFDTKVHSKYEHS